MNRESWIAVIFVLLIAILTVKPWLQDGLPGTDDFRHHVTKFWWLDDQIKNEGAITE
jgi:hypothetical protein